MGQSALDKTYQLDEQQNAEIIALARQRNAEPVQLVREAISKYLRDAEYDARRKAAFAALKHPDRDNGTFGSWQVVDGTSYQHDLRADDSSGL
jgi:hypothetical protein